MSVGGEVDGFTAAGWTAVRAAFADDIASDRELGAAVAVYHRGRPVVDLWGGWFDATHERPYAGDTIQVVFSTGKAVLATAIAIAVERGWLDYDEAVSRYWPEFAAHGKQHATVTELLSHQCGLICPDDPLTLAEVLDWDLVTSSLADTAPDWPTGSGHGYHAITFGWLAGELLRRADPHHRTPRRFVADEIAKPLGLDLWIGLPRQQRHRVTPIVGDLVSFSHDPVVQAITDELMDPSRAPVAPTPSAARSRASARSTGATCRAPRCRRSTRSPTPARSPGCWPRSRPRSTTSACSAPRCSTGHAGR